MKCPDCGIEVRGPCYDGLCGCYPHGTRVRMTEAFKKSFSDSGSDEHIEEFKNSVGSVIGHAEGDWPEIDIRWDEGLRYCYSKNDLERDMSLTKYKVEGHNKQFPANGNVVDPEGHTKFNAYEGSIGCRSCEKVLGPLTDENIDKQYLEHTDKECGMHYNKKA